MKNFRINNKVTEYLVVSNILNYQRMSLWEREHYEASEFNEVAIKMSKMRKLMSKYEKKFMQIAFMDNHFSMEELNKIQKVIPNYHERVISNISGNHTSFFEYIALIFRDKKIVERKLKREARQKRKAAAAAAAAQPSFPNFEENKEEEKELDGERQGERQGGNQKERQRPSIQVRQPGLRMRKRKHEEVMKNYKEDPEFMLAFQNTIRKKQEEIRRLASES